MLQLPFETVSRRIVMNFIYIAAEVEKASLPDLPLGLAVNSTLQGEP